MVVNAGPNNFVPYIETFPFLSVLNHSVLLYPGFSNELPFKPNLAASIGTTPFPPLGFLFKAKNCSQFVPSVSN